MMASTIVTNKRKGITDANLILYIFLTVWGIITISLIASLIKALVGDSGLSITRPSYLLFGMMAILLIMTLAGLITKNKKLLGDSKFRLYFTLVYSFAIVTWGIIAFFG